MVGQVSDYQGIVERLAFNTAVVDQRWWIRKSADRGLRNVGVKTL
jgi:hypothetical protein